ncbi:hypothetical protein CEP52_016548, partial [Fusarium oligoseptatum]
AKTLTVVTLESAGSLFVMHDSEPPKDVPYATSLHSGALDVIHAPRVHALGLSSLPTTRPLHKDTANAQADHNTTNNFQPTEYQLEERIKKFIDSLDEDAICRLASQHNGQKPCRVVGRDRGSFNVCFFIHFDQDGMRWVSEVTTMRCCQEEGDIKTFASARQYMDYQYRVLSKTYSLPTEELSRKQAQMELFALDSLEKQIPVLASSQRANDPFVLAHMDLRCGNIMVTEDLHILAIIDWEFAGTIPQQLFTPPPCITGHDLDAVAAAPHYTAYPEFLQVLEEKSSTSQTCAKLRDDWKSLPDLAFPIAQILRHPSCLIRVYYKFIFPKLYDGEKGSVVPEFFERQELSNPLQLRSHGGSRNRADTLNI